MINVTEKLTALQTEIKNSPGLRAYEKAPLLKKIRGTLSAINRFKGFSYRNQELLLKGIEEDYAKLK